MSFPVERNHASVDRAPSDSPTNGLPTALPQNPDKREKDGVGDEKTKDWGVIWQNIEENIGD